MVKRRVYKGGTVQSKISPKDIQFTPGDLSPSPNTLASPARFPDNNSIFAGRGCDGTTRNILAAEGQYVPMQTGGGGGICLSQSPLMGNITGPSAGHAGIQRCNSNVEVNAMSLGAGGVAKVGRGATVNPWPGSGGRRKKSTRHRHRGCSKKCRSRKRSRSMRKRSMRKRSMRKRKKRRKCPTKRVHRRRQRGGEGQPYSNEPLSFGYGLGGPLPGDNVSNDSALANPPPQHVYNHCETNKW